MVSAAAKREAVARLQAGFGMSERRACAVIGADRKSMRYRSCRPDDTDLRDRLRELAAERRRFGYRRLHILLRRDGIAVNRKKVQRLYREEGLTVRRRRGRRRAVGRRRHRCWRFPTSVGASTSSMTNLPQAGGSGRSTSSTT